MELARCTVSVCFNYSMSFSNDDFSSFKISTKEARLLRNDILSLYKIKMSQVIVQLYKLSHPALGTKLRFANFKHDRLHIALPVNQSKLSYWNLREKGRRFRAMAWHSWVIRDAMHSGKKWRNALWLNAMHSGKKWWIREFVSPSIYSS